MSYKPLSTIKISSHENDYEDRTYGSIDMHNCQFNQRPGMDKRTNGGMEGSPGYLEGMESR
jgi:hypothetical protein